MEDVVGKPRIEDHVKKAAYFISAGTNDFVLNYFSLPLRRKSYTLQAYQNFLIQRITDFIQAQGWKEKSKTLEEVLESTSKMEPKLIGYDETPIDVTDTNIAKNIMVTADL